jgi:sec-independent protein translocase protein TatA
MLGTQDLLIGLAIVFFLFGAKRLPELAGSLGKSMKEFKKAVEGSHAEEPEEPKPAGEIQAAAPAPRACVSCQAVLEPDWRHCPRCGSAVPPPPAGASS